MSTSQDKTRDIFVFLEGKGISLNIEQELLPEITEERFELSNNNPLIKINKNNNFSEHDHYIEDPTSPEMKNEVLNNIIFSDGRTSLKKDAIDIIYCCFDLFCGRDKATALTSSSYSFYVKILLSYPPELKYNSLVQYFAILERIFLNENMPLEVKYMMTSKALEVEWEKCNFIKYLNFKSFLTIMKRVLKVSPLSSIKDNPEENTGDPYQELLKRSLTGRVNNLLSYLIDSDDPLKMLMIVRTVDWLQKLESSKILSNVNINNIMKKGKDKNALDMLRHMYGKLNNLNSKEEGEENSGSVQKVEDNKVQNIPEDPISSSVQNQGQRDISVKSGNSEQAGAKNVDPANDPKSAINNPMKRSARDDNGDNKLKLSEKSTNKVNLFFEIYNSQKYQADFPGRINNFLKQAIRLDYKHSPSKQERIETIIVRYLNDFNPEQVSQILRNYRKFCQDFEMNINNNVITNLERKTVQNSQPTSKSPPSRNAPKPQRAIIGTGIPLSGSANMRASADTVLIHTQLKSNPDRMIEEFKINTVPNVIGVKEVIKEVQIKEIKQVEPLKSSKKEKKEMKSSMKSATGETSDRVPRTPESSSNS